MMCYILILYFIGLLIFLILPIISEQWKNRVVLEIDTYSPDNNKEVTFFNYKNHLSFEEYKKHNTIIYMLWISIWPFAILLGILYFIWQFLLYLIDSYYKLLSK